ncbi:DUF6026 family protein [Pseudomonas fluorescens]|uniref:Uncharacterized protein n=1 Tax=Pseudomonas fluorescens TaxID=294 RepID=A0A5E7C919_PSEFL|nr:DUF6026 family protein [Pseudomonas fluorescens]VVN92251.1 hypothetical protein PS723_01965 [Pseudomonas fluorescens]
MGTVLSARPPQTLYVTVRRDELRQLKDEREQLFNEIAHLRLQLQALGCDERFSRPLIRALD